MTANYVPLPGYPKISFHLAKLASGVSHAALDFSQRRLATRY
jgi:hypothetical protein